MSQGLNTPLSSPLIDGRRYIGQVHTSSPLGIPAERLDDFNIPKNLTVSEENLLVKECDLQETRLPRRDSTKSLIENSGDCTLTDLEQTLHGNNLTFSPQLSGVFSASRLSPAKSFSTSYLGSVTDTPKKRGQKRPTDSSTKNIAKKPSLDGVKLSLAKFEYIDRSKDSVGIIPSKMGTVEDAPDPVLTALKDMELRMNAEAAQRAKILKQDIIREVAEETKIKFDDLSKEIHGRLDGYRQEDLGRWQAWESRISAIE